MHEIVEWYYFNWKDDIKKISKLKATVKVSKMKELKYIE
jgi:hypothetical protein